MQGVYLRNRITGEIIFISKSQSRLARMRRRVFAWAELIADEVKSRRCDLVMVTLTYAKIEGWASNHIREFMILLRRKWHIKAYAWVMELQKRGAPHYHLLAVVERPYHKIKPDAWGWWPHGMTRTEKARTPFYIAKYAQKGFHDEKQKAKLPKGARIFATWAGADMDCGRKWANFVASKYPQWVREICSSLGCGLDVQRAVGGGWRIGGTLYNSRYDVVEIAK